jgi:hypothetical protein
MEAFRTETIVQADGTLTLCGLPFATGKTVEVIVLETTEAITQPANQPENRYPLRGMSYTYIDPFEPAVPAEDWEVYQPVP